jgi:hypothetical protein
MCPSSGFIMGEVHKAVVDNAAEFQTKSTTALDGEVVAPLFDFAIKQGGVLAAWLIGPGKA